MNYLIIAISAYLLNAVSVTIDKILLVKRLPNPALYVFYISLFSLAVLLLAPFTPLPNSYPLAIASASTILWTLGAYFMFKALKSGEAARVVPIIGTLIPVILLFMSGLEGSVNLNEIWAVLILLFGLIFLVLPYLGFNSKDFFRFKGGFPKDELILEITSALFFANSYYLLKLAYNLSDFLSVFVYSRLILIPIILLILIIPAFRKWIFKGTSTHQKVNLWSKTGFILFIGQACGGASQMLLTFAISLASPAVINSLQGIQYVFLFILSLTLSKKFPLAFKEHFTKLNITGRIIGIILIFSGLFLLSFSAIETKNPRLGLTFSPRYAQELGLDPNEVFNAIITDLKPSVIRLPIYWDEVEKEKGEYDFTQTEKYLNHLNQANIKAILVLGYKQPRWPECFQPGWSKNESAEEFNQSVINLVSKEVSHFKNNQTILYWQLENEPLLSFGVCPKPNVDRLKKEFETVKSLDSREIIITDSGELSNWTEVMKLTDIFGSTLYRSVWNPWFGIVEYPWPPIFYKSKAEVIKFISSSQNKKVIISELQAEPWPDQEKSLSDISIENQKKLFPINKFIDNYEYATQTTFDEIYLWGVEWWYFMKKNNIPEYWLLSKMIFEKSSL